MKRVSITVLVLLIAGLILSTPIKAEDLDPVAVMKAFGAKGEEIFSAREIAGYGENYGRMDSNHDGFLTTDEYIANSGHFRANPAGAEGFMRISDNDRDGGLSCAEYVMNRIITDEAKEIYTRIDPATDWTAVPAFRWRMKRAAFVGSDYFADEKMAAQIFTSMDVDGDGVLRLPEYLKAYGHWARAGLPKEILDGNK
ncbi:MAG: hypothetical protein JRJ85_23160 [Deltaproteobacteria bacterium]|nr:hypothetical protein [Deltaproteobacteria bacterium]